MNRRAIVFLFASLLAGGSLVQAQGAFPTRTVRFIVPFPPGGINDVLARIVGENKTGAGGNIGADLAVHAEPDGYTLLVAPPGPLAINQTLYRQLSYKP